MHLVFDMDGVLLDSASDLSWLDRALDGALEALGLPATDESRSRLFPVSVDQIDELAHQLDVEAERLWAVRDDHYVRAKLEAVRSREIEPFDDASVLPELAKSHDLHIISNSPQVIVDAFVETNGFDALFDVRLGRVDGDLKGLHRLKPDPSFYHELIDHLDGSESLVYIGDTESDRTFAEATGMHFIHLTRDQRGTASLRAVPALLE